ETYSYTFTKPGTYEYFCTLHPLMTGKVVVRSGS
ncbi:MAG TPA: plastocyanin/azurin family copper-binding protein, partial [Candidatus Dormibacteraeota bacterium]|nr:plastocyanin/azurin family copper-binding protein [Candidatus Dormibacteraeota bacterium]